MPESGTLSLVRGRLVIASVLLLAPAGCGDGDESAAASPASVRVSGRPVTIGREGGGNLVSFRPQSGDGRSVLVDRVVLEKRGWLAVHADGGGSPGAVLGTTGPLDPGAHANLAVRLDRRLPDGPARVWPLLHAETNGNDRFDYPVADTPVGYGSDQVPVPLEVIVD